MEKEQVLKLIEYLEDYKESRNADQLKFVLNKTIQVMKNSIQEDPAVIEE